MRTIEQTGQFRRDYKRESKGKYRATLDTDLLPVLSLLANDEALEVRYRDHALAATGATTGIAMPSPTWC